MLPHWKILSSLLIFTGITLAFSFLLLFDRAAGIYLNKIGYFKAMKPSFSEIYETSEFNFTAHISPQGLRNEEVSVSKPKGAFRILALGDSFTFGWGVDLKDSWPKVLQELLSGQNVEIINAGVYGANPDMYSGICKIYKDQFKPDLIIAGLYSTDDLYQAVASVQARPDRDIVSRFWPTLTSIKDPVLMHGNYYDPSAKELYLSPVWRKVIVDFVADHKEFFSGLGLEAQKEFLSGRLNPGLIMESQNDPDYLIRTLDENDLNTSLAALDLSFRKLKEECSDNILLVVVFLPSSELVSKDYLPFKESLGYKVSEDLLKFDPGEKIRPIAGKFGFSFVSLLDNFREDGCLNCFYKWDGHLTAEGNKRTAEFLLDKIAPLVTIH